MRHETRAMYNLTGATAHTFFVGAGRWLVHNECFIKYDMKQVMRKFSKHATDWGFPNGNYSPARGKDWIKILDDHVV